MKKNRAFILFAATACFLGIIFTACELAVPKNINLRTKGNYSFNLGKFRMNGSEHAFTMSDYLSLEKIKEMMGDKSFSSGESGSSEEGAEAAAITAFNIYDYNPGNKSNIQKYLVEFNIGKNVELDISKYFENFDLDSMLADQAKSFNQTVTAPKMTDIGDQTIDTKDIIGDKMGMSAITFNAAAFPILESAGGKLEGLPGMDIEMQGIEFTTMTFYSGSIELPVLRSEEHSAGYQLKMTFDIQDISGNSIVKTEIEHFETANKVVFDLAGKTIYKKMKLVISGEVVQTGSKLVNYTIGGNLSLGGTKVYKITGLSQTLDTYPISNTVTLGVESVFVECLIGKGNIALESAIPDGWTGITFTKDIRLSGSIEAEETDWSKAGETDAYLMNRNLKLDGKSFRAVDYSDGGETKRGIKINFEGTITPKLDNATIIMPEGVYPTLSLKPTVNLEEISYMIINMESYLSNLSLGLESDLPEEFKSYVKSVELAPSGFELDYTNNLPAGNDVTVTVDSNFFDMTGKSAVITSSGTSEVRSTSVLCEDKTKITPATNSGKIDITASLGFPVPDESTGYSSRTTYPYYYQLKGINLGETYTLHADIKPVFDWHEITLNAENFQNIKTESDIDTGISLASMMDSVAGLLGEDFISRLGLKSLPLLIYCQCPELDSMMNKFAIDGKIVLGNYDKDNNYTYGHILDDDAQKTVNLGDLEFVASYDQLEQDENGVVINDLEKDSLAEKIDLASLYSAENQHTIGLYYKVGIKEESGDGSSSTITVSKDDYNKLINEKLSTTLGVTGRMIIPLELSVAAPAPGKTDEVDLMAILKAAMSGSSEEGESGSSTTNEDLFQRTEASDFSGIMQFISVVESASINYKLTNNLLNYEEKGKELKVSFTMPATNSAGEAISWENPDYLLSLTSEEKQKANITVDDLDTMMKTYPFSPGLYLTIPEGTISIPRDAYLDAVFSVGVHTDGVIDVMSLVGAAASEGGN